MIFLIDFLMTVIINYDKYKYLIDVFCIKKLDSSIENFYKYNEIIKKYLNLKIESDRYFHSSYKLKQNFIGLTYLQFFNLYYCVQEIIETTDDKIMFYFMYYAYTETVFVNYKNKITDNEMKIITLIYNRLINLKEKDVTLKFNNSEKISILRQKNIIIFKSKLKRIYDEIQNEKIKIEYKEIMMKLDEINEIKSILNFDEIKKIKTEHKELNSENEKLKLDSENFKQENEKLKLDLENFKQENEKLKIKLNKIKDLC
jgi:hypothetical protein